MTDMAKITQHIEEQVVEGKRLGRHVEHDPLSKNFAFGATLPFDGMQQVLHKHHGSILDQGDIGSCTGNAAAQALNTDPLHSKGEHLLKEQEALDLYELATTLDGVPGEYPPDDTGSSGLGVAKAALAKGYITQYRHAFSVDEAVTALHEAPVITGVNWYEGFDEPDEHGIVSIAGQVRGGHEICVIGFEPRDTYDSSLLKILNSWGHSWGDHGHFFWTVATWRTLLQEQGDVTILG